MPETPPEEPGTTQPHGKAATSAGSESVPYGSDLMGRALDDLGREIRARLGSGPRGDAGLPPPWFDLFDELRSRARTLGMVERRAETDDFGCDTELLRRSRPLLDLLRKRWWRIDVRGAEGLPEGPILFVANRSGILPYDGLMIAHVVAEACSESARPRFLVADWLVTLPFAQSTLTRMGGVRACRENAERLLGTGRSVVAFPEGLKGAGKVFRERYQVKRFGRGGVVRVALETGAPLVPVAVIGAEEAHPVLFKVEMLARSVGLPFVPVTPTFPLLGPLGAVPLPSKWSIRFGEPIRTGHLEADAGRDELLVSRLTEELRSQIQSMVDEDLRTREGVFAGWPGGVFTG